MLLIVSETRRRSTKGVYRARNEGQRPRRRRRSIRLNLKGEKSSMTCMLAMSRTVRENEGRSLSRTNRAQEKMSVAEPVPEACSCCSFGGVEA